MDGTRYTTSQCVKDLTVTSKRITGKIRKTLVTNVPDTIAIALIVIIVRRAALSARAAVAAAIPAICSIATIDADLQITSATEINKICRAQKITGSKIELRKECFHVSLGHVVLLLRI